MKHLQIFEDFKGEFSPLTRDLFDLNHTFKIDDYYGDTGIRIVGPVENMEIVQGILKNSILLDIQKANRDFGKTRSLYVTKVNDILKNWIYTLSKNGYRITNWYNGAMSPDESK